MEIPSLIKDIMQIAAIVGFFTGGYLALDHFSNKVIGLSNQLLRIENVMVKSSDEDKERDVVWLKEDREWARRDEAHNTKIQVQLENISKQLEKRSQEHRDQMARLNQIRFK